MRQIMTLTCKIWNI